MASALERDRSAVDDLTEAYHRGPGFLMLEREMLRAARTAQPLTLAFLDVDNLKAVNDSNGHAAGDRMLLRVADVLRARLRSYDLLIRLGGDEFACAITGLDLAASEARFVSVCAALSDGPEPGSITFGLAEMRDDDTMEELVARADSELYRKRLRDPSRHR